MDGRPVHWEDLVRAKNIQWGRHSARHCMKTDVNMIFPVLRTCHALVITKAGRYNFRRLVSESAVEAYVTSIAKKRTFDSADGSPMNIFSNRSCHLSRRIAFLRWAL